jgi:hypothetical protein
MMDAVAYDWTVGCWGAEKLAGQTSQAGSGAREGKGKAGIEGGGVLGR